MKPIDTTALRSAIRETAAELYRQGQTTPDAFLREFNSHHADLITDDVIRYGFEQFVVDEGRAAMKRVGRASERVAGATQLVLPIAFSELDIPSSLQIKRGGLPVWVPLPKGTLADGDAYARALRANVEACTESLIDFEFMWRDVRPLLVANPTWRIGDALQYLVDRDDRAG